MPKQPVMSNPNGNIKKIKEKTSINVLPSYSRLIFQSKNEAESAFIPFFSGEVDEELSPVNECSQKYSLR